MPIGWLDLGCSDMRTMIGPDVATRHPIGIGQWDLDVYRLTAVELLMERNKYLMPPAKIPEK